MEIIKLTDPMGHIAMMMLRSASDTNAHRLPTRLFHGHGKRKLGSEVGQLGRDVMAARCLVFCFIFMFERCMWNGRG